MTRIEDTKVDILLVDDRPENLLALEAILEPLGQRLVRASSGEDALRCLLERDFALILLDVQMPGINGFETAQLIKARERSKFIPIIFLTAISKEDEYVFQGYSVGAVDYISKPFQPAILRSKVQVFVELRLQQRRIAEQELRIREIERHELELRHMRELVQSEARFGEIVSTAMDAIIMFDGEGAITLVNGAAEVMFGVKSADAVGASITRFFPEGRSNPWSCAPTIAVGRVRRRVAADLPGAADGAPVDRRNVPDRGVGVVPQCARWRVDVHLDRA